MQIAENIPLSSLTTLKVGGNARYVAKCESQEDIETALAHAREGGLPWYVIGGGSNLLVSDDGYDGVIIRPHIGNVSFEDTDDSCVVTAGAGVPWDALVEATTSRGLWGLENLAAIPGLVGGAPVQNIGAYGADVSDTLLFVDAFDTKTNTLVRFANEECAFAYRDSRFKSDQSLIILQAAFTLSKKGEPQISYPDLVLYRIQAEERKESFTTPADVARGIRAIRANKFPDLSVMGTAGSFFKNPIVPAEDYAKLNAAYPGIPMYPVIDASSGEDSGTMKVPLAWILDHALNLRGFTMGHALLFERQPLVLCTTSGATSSEVESLAQYVENLVKEKTGIVIEREVRML